MANILVSEEEREIFNETKKAELLKMYENRQEKVGFHTFRLCESLNVSAIKSYTSDQYNKKKITDRVARKYNDTWAAAAKNYLDHALKPKLYNKGKGRREIFGRDYNHASHGIQTLPREMREDGTKGIYGDVDMNAAHQAFLIILARVKDENVPHVLVDYVENKQFIREREASNCGVSVGEFKEAVCAATYGKKWNTFSHKMKRSQWLKQYTATVRQLAGRVVDQNDKDEEAKSDDNKKDDYTFTVLAELLARIESQLLYTAMEFLDGMGFLSKRMMLLFDGVLVHLPSNPDIEITQTVLDNLYIYVKDKLKVSVGWSYTYWKDDSWVSITTSHSYDKLENYEPFVFTKKIEGSRNKQLYKPVTSDVSAAEKFLYLYPHIKCVGCGDSKDQKLFAFNDSTGKWEQGDSIIYNKVMEYRNFFKLQKYDKKEKIFIETNGYGDQAELMARLPRILKNVKGVYDADWEKRLDKTSLRKVLFKNGILDLETLEFRDKDVAGFDPDILFYQSIDHNYTKWNEEDEKEMDIIENDVWKATFDQESGEAFLVTISRAFAGDGVNLQRLLWVNGLPNSGKSSWKVSLEEILGLDWVLTVGAGRLYQQKKGCANKDVAQDNRWALLGRGRRFLIISEVMEGERISGTAILSFASGGEKLEGREHGSNEKAFSMHCFPLIVANSFLPIEPFNEQQKKRCLFAIQTKKYVDSSVEDITNTETELPMNHNFLNELRGSPALIHQPAYRRLYVLVLIRAFHRWYIEQGRQNSESYTDEPSAWKKNYEELLGDSVVQPMELFLQSFEITACEHHFTPNWMLETFINNKLNGQNQIKQLLNKYGMDTCPEMMSGNTWKKIKKRTEAKEGGRSLNPISCWVGIREHVPISFKTFNQRCSDNHYSIVSTTKNPEDEFEEGARNLFTYKPKLKKQGIRLTNGPAVLYEDKTVEEWLDEWTTSNEEAETGRIGNRAGVSQFLEVPVRTA